VALTGASFTDTYPSNVVNASTPNLLNTCGGTATGNAGAGAVSLSGATIPANGTCVVFITVTSSVGGVYTNTIPVGGLNSSAGPSTSAASDTLTVSAPPTIAKTFVPPTIGVGGTSHLTITLSNATGAPLTGAALTDTYP